MPLGNDRRSLTQDRRALFELRQRLFAQGLELHAESDSSAQDAAGSAPSESVPSFRVSTENGVPAPNVGSAIPPAYQNWDAPAEEMQGHQQVPDKAELPDESDASVLIRRRLFAEHPSHNPLDTTDELLSEKGFSLRSSVECVGKHESGVDTVFAPANATVARCLNEDSMESTIGPGSPDEHAVGSPGRPPGSESLSLLQHSGPSPGQISGNVFSPPSVAEHDVFEEKRSTTVSPEFANYCNATPCTKSCASSWLGGPEEDAPIHQGSNTFPSHHSNSCEICVEDVGLVQEFERVNELLRRHGFGSIPHRLEPLTFSLVGPRSRLVADGRGLWGLCSEVLVAYEERGKRLRDALLAERSEGRKLRDSRVKELLQENSRLESEVRKLRDVPRTATPAVSPATKTPTAEKELSDLALKVKAAEALARHREREMDQLRVRLEQAIAEGARRQEREREALAKPLRRRGAARDDPLLAVAVAHQAKAESLQAELSTLTKHSHTLSFQLDAAEERCRKLEAQQQFQSSGKTVTHEAPNMQVQDEEIDRLRQAVAREAELRSRVEEQLQAQLTVHADAMQSLGQRLNEAEARTVQLETERREALQHPSPGELRWQREGLRLRDQLAEAKRTWRSADPRVLIRRDKEIRSLGLDPRALEDTARKGDLVSILLDVCGQLKVGDVSQIAPRISSLADLHGFSTGVADVLQELGEAPCPNGDVGAVLNSLRQIAMELRRLRGNDASQKAAAAGEAAERAQNLRVAEEGFRALAAELRLPQGAAPSDCLQRVTELRIKEAVLDGLAAQLRCREHKDLAQRVDSLLKLCDERLAAQRIVDALQKLLRAGGIEEVLPALRDVLDISALRRRAAAQTDGVSDSVPAGGK